MYIYKINNKKNETSLETYSVYDMIQNKRKLLT